VHLELTPQVEGYRVRIMRCAAGGGASAAQRATAERICALQDTQVAAMRRGTEDRLIAAHADAARWAAAQL